MFLHQCGQFLCPGVYWEFGYARNLSYRSIVYHFCDPVRTRESRLLVNNAQIPGISRIFQQ
jgi:hypothetical protein